jgi:signal transduction histidine kinase
MIKKLRIKFILITMAAMLALFGAVFATLWGFTRYESAKQTERFVQMMQEREQRDNYNEDKGIYGDAPKEGVRPKNDPPEDMMQEGRNIENVMLSRIIKITLLTLGGTILLLFVFVFFLSKWAIKPVNESFEKQKRFISDASHELKTPLTIIGANLDILAEEIGGDSHITHIRKQSARMNSLINSLLSLARSDEEAEVMFSKFNLSATVLNTALEFESRAYEENKNYSYEIAENLQYNGAESQIKQLAGILIDNAIKYGNDIKISLKRKNNHTHLSVYNTGEGISDNEKAKIFDRFYRVDSSRQREDNSPSFGGYGLGLSIAKAIVDSHKGKILVDGEQGKWVRFEVIL